MQQLHISKKQRGFIEPVTFLLLSLAIGGSAVMVGAMDDERAFAEAPTQSAPLEVSLQEKAEGLEAGR